MLDVPVGMLRSSGQTEQAVKVQGHNTLYRYHNIQDHHSRSYHHLFYGTWIQFNSFISSYIATSSSCRWVVITFHAGKASKNAWLDEGGKISPYVANSVELALVVLYHIASAFVCMVQVGWPASKRYWLEGIGVCMMSCKGDHSAMLQCFQACKTSSIGENSFMLDLASTFSFLYCSSNNSSVLGMMDTSPSKSWIWPGGGASVISSWM